jgi:Flp pilus assembly protein TadD
MHRGSMVLGTRWVLVAIMAGSVPLLPTRLVGAPATSSNPADARVADARMANPRLDGATPTELFATEEADSLFVQAGRLYAQRRFSEAIPLFQRVVELEPRHGNAYALLGGSYFQLGDYHQAIRAFEQALALDEGIKLAYIGLVAANYLTRRVENAQEWLVRLVPLLNGEERDRYLATLSSQFPELTLPDS